MKVRLALLLLMIAAALIAVAILRFPSVRPPASPARPPSPPPQKTESSAQQLVLGYLESLNKKDFRAAYSQLSKASQQAHTYEDFTSLAEKSGVPNYDLSAAREKTEGDRASVTVPLAEDPAEATFTMVREDGAWKVVFIGGVPAFPYAE
jgi:hypothetical protein